MVRLLLAVIVLIAYLSLYPWEFLARPGINPLRVLWNSWYWPFGRYGIRDVALNLLLYVPVGIAAGLAVARRATWIRVAWPVVIGFLLSASMELIQVYDRTRYCSAVDLACNTVGTLAGSLLAIAFARPLSRAVASADAELRKRPCAVLLAMLWCGYRLYPLFPQLSLYWLGIKLRAFASPSGPWIVPCLTAFLAIAALGHVMRTAGLRWPVTALLALAIPAGFIFQSQQPSLAECAGAALGLLVSVRFPVGGWTLAMPFVALLVVRGLWPFSFAGPGQVFNWIPFELLLQADWQSSPRIFLEKCFYYGTAVWLLHIARVPLLRSALIVAAVLAGIEFAQRWIPGRYPDVTDPLIALALAAVFHLLQESPARGSGRLHA